MKKLLILVGCAALSFGVHADNTKLKFQGQSVSDAGANAYIDASQGSVYGSDLGDRVPDAIAPSYPTAHTCALGIGGGAAVSGFGISVGGHYTDEDCVLRLDSAQAARLNQPNTARELMCTKFVYYASNKRAIDEGSEEYQCRSNKKFDDKLAEDTQAAYIPASTEAQAAADIRPTAAGSDDGFAWQRGIE